MMFQNLEKSPLQYKHAFLSLYVILLLINNSACDTSNVFAQEFTDQFFIVQPSQGWELLNAQQLQYQPYTQQTVCGSLSILGGYSKLGAGSQLQKEYDNIPPHYELRVELNMYFLDNQNMPSDNVHVSLDDQDGGSFDQNNAVVSRQICGLQTIDRIWNYSKTIQHTSTSLKLSFRDDFDLTPNQISWGIRDIYLRITGLCDSTCLQCSGPNANQCIACKNGNKPSNGTCPSTTPTNQGSNNNNNNNNNNNGSSSSNSVDIPWTACDTAINDYAQNLMYTKQSTIIKDAVTFEQDVIISMAINFSNTNISLDCRAQMINQIFYQNSDTELQLFPADNITLDLSTYTLSLKFNLADAQTYARTATSQNSNIIYSIYIILLSGNSKQMVRDHKFELLIVTQGEQTFNYLMDVNVQQTTDNCSDLVNGCLVIADLAIEGSICYDEQCAQVYSSTSAITKQIGQYLITRLRFTDRTYIQKLNLIQILFRGDDSVFDFTAFSTLLLNDGKGTIIVKTLLMEPSKNATFQYNLKIGDDTSRFLQSTTSTNNAINQQQSYQFKVTIIKSTDNSQAQAATSGNKLTFIFIAVILFQFLTIF